MSKIILSETILPDTPVSAKIASYFKNGFRSLFNLNSAGIEVAHPVVFTIGGIPHKEMWMAGAQPTLTNGCAASAQLELATNKNVVDYLAFDASAIEYAYANTLLPQDYSGGPFYAMFYWSHPATTVNFGVGWGLQIASYSNDDALDQAYGTAQYANDIGGTTSDIYVTPITAAITPSGTPVAGDFVSFRVLRNATDATNDTLAVDAYLIGVKIFIPVI